LDCGRFFNLVYAWLYDSMTMMQAARDPKFWDEHYAQFFKRAGGSPDGLSDEERIRKQVGLRAAAKGEQASLKQVKSRMPKMTSGELKARQKYFVENPVEAARVGELDWDGKREALVAWLESERSTVGS
jgi:hypothetical protein